jgi:hypothetical protein
LQRVAEDLLLVRMKMLAGPQRVEVRFIFRFTTMFRMRFQD